MPLPYFLIYPLRNSLILISIIVITGCKKDSIGIDVWEIESGTMFELSSVCSMDGKNIFITGGVAEQGIILKSLDGGNNFSVLNNDFKQRVNDIAWWDTINGIAVANDFKAYSTSDKGATWLPIWFNGFLSIEYQTHIFNVTLVNDSTVYFCGGWQYGKGIIGKSTNYGKAWSYKPVDHEMRKIQFFDLLHGICVGYGAMLITDNGGLTWIESAAKNQFWTGLSLYQNIAYACSYGGAIAESIDFGKSWSILHTSNIVLQNAGQLNSINTPDGFHLFTAGNKGSCFFSNDFGKSWKSTNSFGDQTINDLKLLGSNDGICVGNNGKIFLFRY